MTQSSLSLNSMATKTEKFLLNNPFWFLLFLVGLVAFLLLANIAIFPSLTLRGDIALDKIFIGTITHHLLQLTSTFVIYNELLNSDF